LDNRGLIYKDTYAGWYSVSDESFYTDAQITRTTDPVTSEETTISTETGSLVSYSSEETYKFRISTFRDQLLHHFRTNPSSIQPTMYFDQIVGHLSKENGELEDLSISRPKSRLSWGVHVPGDPEHTIYVWIDALTIYLTGAGYPWAGGNGGEKGGWPADLQVIGKDILRYSFSCQKLSFRQVHTNLSPPDSMQSTSQRCFSRCPCHYQRLSSRMHIGPSTKRRCPNHSEMSQTQWKPWTSLA
jgi:methionyl-tRNA synthetase